jgi:hypothetical protein
VHKKQKIPKQKNQEYKNGDVFAFEITPKEYGFGRVLLDIYNQAMNPGLIDSQSTLDLGRDDTILVELYSNTGSINELNIDNLETLTPSVLTSSVLIKCADWKICGHKEVDVEKIDFPEFITEGGFDNSDFIKGELKVNIPLEIEVAEELELYLGDIAAFSIPYIVLMALNRADEIDDYEGDFSRLELKNYDLRYSQKRNEILALLPDEYKGSYFEVSKNHSFDLSRFYS